MSLPSGDRLDKARQLAAQWRTDSEQHTVAADHTAGDHDEEGRWAMSQTHAAKARILRRCSDELAAALGDPVTLVRCLGCNHLVAAHALLVGHCHASAVAGRCPCTHVVTTPPQDAA